MVQVIQPKQNVGSSLGQAINQGFNQTFPSLFNQQYQRGLVKDSLKELQGLSQNPNATPFDLATSLISSTAGIPGSEKYVGQLFPLLMNQMQLKQQQGMQLPGGQQGMQPPGGQQLAPQERQRPISLSEALNANNASVGASPEVMGGASSRGQPEIKVDNRVPEWVAPPSGDIAEYSLDPTALGKGPLPNVYSPEEIFQAGQQAVSRGLPAETVTNPMESHNQRAREQVKDYVSAAKTQAEIADLRNAQQERFQNKLRDVINSGADEPVSEADFAVANRISQRPELIKLGDEKIRAEKTKKLFDEYQFAKNNFVKNSSRPPLPGLNKRIVENLKQEGKVLVENGQMDLAQRTLQENGWGPGESENILNPLPDSVSKTMKDMPKLQDPLEMIKILPNQPEFPSEYTKAKGERDKKISEYQDYIKNIIHPGSLTKTGNFIPGTSLLLLQKEFMDKGGDHFEFSDVIRNLMKEGSFIPDPHQTSQLGMINRDPIQNLGFWEVIRRGASPVIPYESRY